MNQKFVLAKTLSHEDAQELDVRQAIMLDPVKAPASDTELLHTLLGSKEKYATGIGGKIMYVYNYTNRPLGYFDRSNHLSIVSPIRDETAFLKPISIEDMIVGSVVVEVRYFQGASNYHLDEFDSLIHDRQAAFGETVQKVINNAAFVNKNCFIPTGGIAPGGYTGISRVDGELVVRHVFRDFWDTVKKYGGSVYSEELDLVFDGLSKEKPVVVHPRSTESILACAGERLLDDRENRLKLEIKINDSAYHHEKAFINIAGGVLAVPITRLADVPDGITVCYSSSLDSATRDDFYTFDQECPFKIFGSSTLAATYGDAAKVAEQANLQRKEEAAQKAHELAMEKLRNDMAKLEAEKVAFELKIEQDAAKAKAEKEAFERKIEQSRVEHERQLELRDKEIRDMREKEVIETKRHLKEMAASNQRMIEAEATAAREKERAERAERLKEEHLSRTEALENASFFRKNVSEALKIAGTIVSAAAAFATIYIKFFK